MSFSTTSQTNKAVKNHIRVFTGHGLSQRAPCQPAVQVQDPSAGLHFAPLAQRQLALHPGPQVPSEHGVEQASPRQPADAHVAMLDLSHGWYGKLFYQFCSRLSVNRVNQWLSLTLWEQFTLFAEASPINGRAVNKVVTGALQGAVLAIGATFTWTLTVNPLQ